MATILTKINSEKFDQFKANPDDFIIQAAKIINNKKVKNVISSISYNKVNQAWTAEEIFMTDSIEGVMGENVVDAKKHIYDKVRYDSNIEKNFARELDVHDNVEMYIKLPGSFYIHTPMGKYNPDWAIVLKKDNIKYVYFVAETKGAANNLELELKGVENAKIEAARKHFAAISKDNIVYDVVDTYEKLMEKISG
jgi:type III restriction enzyme